MHWNNMHHFTKCITTFRYLLFADMRTNFAYYYRNFLMSSCFQFVLNVKIFGTYSIILGPNHTMLLWVLRVLLNLIFESSIDHPLGKLKFQILICSRFTRHSVALCLPNHDQYYGPPHVCYCKYLLGYIYLKIFTSNFHLTVDIPADVQVVFSQKKLLPQILGVVMGCKNMKTKFCWDASQLRYEPWRQKTEKTEISPKVAGLTLQSRYMTESLLQSQFFEK